MENFWGKLTLAFDVYTLLYFLFHFALGAITCFAFLRFFFRKEIRMFKNLGRKVYLLKTGERNLETENELLIKNGLYDVHERILDLTQDTSSLQTIKSFSVFVVGYSPDYSRYSKIVEYAKQKNIPLVVIAKMGEIDNAGEHMRIFRQYVYFELCNTPARLMTTIFNLSVIIPA